jgi:adenylate cyclase
MLKPFLCLPIFRIGIVSNIFNFFAMILPKSNSICYIFGFFLLFSFGNLQLATAQDADKLLAKYNALLKEAKESQAYKPVKTPPNRRPKPNTPPPPREVKVIKQETAKTAVALADAYLEVPDYRNAIFYFGEASKIAESINDFTTSAIANRKLGDHYTKNNIYNSAIKSYVDAAQDYQIAKKYDVYIDVLIKMGKLHLGKDENKRAVSVFSKAAHEAEFYKELGKMTECYELLARAYTKEGDLESANYYTRMSKGSQAVAAKTQEQIQERETAKQQVEQIDQKQEVIAAKLSSGNLSSAESDELKLQVAALQKQKADAEQKVRIKEEMIKAKIEQLKKKDNELFATTEQLTDSQEKIKQQQMQVMFMAALGVLMLIVIAVVIAAIISARRKNKKLAAQNAEIVMQAQEIEKQKKEIERERDKSEQMLLNILPKATADELKEKGFAVPKSYDLATVLFGDFKGFTNVAEKLTPKEIINELNICFSAFDSICEKHNLERIKTIGDAYMCAGGLPLENTTNPLDAVLAGLEMQEFMKKRKVEKENYGEEYFEMRIGIHTGSVIAGVVGKKKFAYDIWGDTVNLASRMESSGEVSMVNISEATYQLVKNEIYCAYRGEIPAKNKGNVAMYFAMEKWGNK